ncbi:MAG: hypothetical protein ACI845_000699 [Gammaproteobacteria bacterium]|jgi:hypothetical protein
MNQIDTYTNYATPDTHSKGHDSESLLSKIVAGLKTRSKSRRLKILTRYQHQSFIDANLLDDVMGPEIRRVLR